MTYAYEKHLLNVGQTTLFQVSAFFYIEGFSKLFEILEHETPLTCDCALSEQHITFHCVLYKWKTVIVNEVILVGIPISFCGDNLGYRVIYHTKCTSEKKNRLICQRP